MTSTIASTAVYQSVSLERTESSMALPNWGIRFRSSARGSGILGGVGCGQISGRTEQIAGAPPRMKQRLRGIRINFPPHAVDIHLDQVRERIERLIPHVLRDFRAPYDAAGVARKKLQQRILFRRERHGLPIARNALRRSVQNKIGNGNLRRPQLTGTAQQRAKPREQFAEFEGLGEIIVSATIQAIDPIFHGIARSEERRVGK